MIGNAIAGADLTAPVIASILDRAKACSKELSSSPETIIGDVVSAAAVGNDNLTLRLRTGWLTGDGVDPHGMIDLPEIIVAITFHQSGRARPIVICSAGSGPSRDADLIALVADARRWMAMLVSGEAASVNEITRLEGRAKGTVSRILPLASLAPDISQAILDGTQPGDLTTAKLRSVRNLPVDWSEQRTLLGFPAL